MHSSYQTYVACSLVLVSFLMSMCQAQSTCHLQTRPHPRGLCGARLRTAHYNLCFLMSMRYPEHFPGKRSSNEIFSIPLPVLADIDLSKDNWDSNLLQKAYAQPREDELRDGTPYSLEEDSHIELPAQKVNPTAQLIRMLSKRSGVVQKRTSEGMVCDCCMRLCTTEELAVYC